MSLLSGDLLERTLRATGRAIPPEQSVHGLEDLPQHIMEDVDAIYAKEVNMLCLVAYLHHVTDADLMKIKEYLYQKGWYRFEE